MKKATLMNEIKESNKEIDSPHSWIGSKPYVKIGQRHQEPRQKRYTNGK